MARELEGTGWKYLEDCQDASVAVLNCLYEPGYESWVYDPEGEAAQYSNRIVGISMSYSGRLKYLCFISKRHYQNAYVISILDFWFKGKVRF